MSTILVAGSTGYLASRLIPLLLEKGYTVRCLARNPQRLLARRWYDQVQVVAGDVTTPESLPHAMQGVRAAYYLIHNMAAGRGYERLELEAARNFAQAAQRAGVEQIIYVGGLANPQDNLALHLRSRIETGEALREAGVPVTEFRAGVIAGPGSVSFEMIRFIAEIFPILVGPRWLTHRSQPIATQDMISYLLAALETPACRGQVVELGCVRERTYIEVMTEYARIRGLRRIPLLLPLIPPALMAFFIDRLTPVEYAYALPLVEGLQNDSLIRRQTARSLFPSIAPLDYADAIRLALASLDPRRVERLWLDLDRPAGRLLHEGFMISYRKLEMQRPVHAVESVPNGLPLPGGVNSWERMGPLTGETILLKARGRLPGGLWLEWRIRPGGRVIDETIFFAPKDLGGFLYGNLFLAYGARRFCDLIQKMLFSFS